MYNFSTDMEMKVTNTSQSDILVVGSPTKDKCHDDHPSTDTDPVVPATNLESPFGSSSTIHKDDIVKETFTTNCIEIEVQPTDYNNLGNLAEKYQTPVTTSMDNTSHEEVHNSPIKDMDATRSCSNSNITVQADRSSSNNNNFSSTIEKKNDVELGM